MSTVDRRARPTGSERSSATTRPRTERSTKGAATREQILATAGAVFARMGYGGTRLEDIADAAGVSRTTVYHYFRSRRDVFIEVGRRSTVAFGSVVDAARAVTGSWTEVDVESIVVAHLAYLDDHGAVVTTWTQATWNDHDLRDLGIDAQLQQFRTFGLELHRLRGSSDDDPVHDAMAFLGMIERLWYFGRVGGAAIDEHELIRVLTANAVALLDRRH